MGPHVRNSAVSTRGLKPQWCWALAAGEQKSFYVDAGTYGNSANGYATLYYDWTMTCGDETTSGSSSIGTEIGNNLPPCKEPVKQDPPHADMP